MLFNSQFPEGKYTELKPVSILSTLSTLQQRIGERFPGSGLSQVAGELKVVANSVVALTERISRPVWVIRIATLIAIAALLGLVGLILTMVVKLQPNGDAGLVDFLQGAESAINELIFLSIAILFFTTLESRYKRRLSLQSLHRLRSIIHVVDMHQLTKDPAYLLVENVKTDSSPQRSMTAYELTRYLDYCSELLAISSKLAALHVQNFQDSPVLTAVNEVESLASSLSGKIWQKIMILDMAAPGERRKRKN